METTLIINNVGYNDVWMYCPVCNYLNQNTFGEGECKDNTLVYCDNCNKLSIVCFHLEKRNCSTIVNRPLTDEEKESIEEGSEIRKASVLFIDALILNETMDIFDENKWYELFDNYATPYGKFSIETSDACLDGNLYYKATCPKCFSKYKSMVEGR